ncbi:hypothetical protein C483_07007 [Natrialba hulunbeirensis JCM 10989]|uniref:Stage II sporulation protein M n=1 Tax=Natrialba hulunbeirensis JCM 10989 TaxID=1227493 RepID=M0A304_9EURY|nr:stage II sporulation protein M [Natrialba hulunbeirensis]ELY92696.1 hypothetical protein C483_07007 [Natrialba hulunbeirensis JCM 10989]
MSLSDSVTAVVAALRRRPGDLLPVYFLGAALPAIIRVVPMIAALIGILYLSLSGRLESIISFAQETDPGAMPGPEASEEAVEQWVSQFEPLIELLLTPTTVLLIFGSIILTVVLAFVLYAVTTAAQLSACYGRTRNDRGMIAALAGARRYWLRLLGLVLLELVLWIGILGAATVGLVATVGTVSALTGTSVVAVPAVLLALLVVAVLLAAVRALFAFAPVAVVADDTGVLGSLSSTAGFIRARPVDAVFYYALSIGSFLVVGVLSSILLLVEVVAFTSLVTMIVLLPALDLLKMALYVNYRGRLEPPEMPDHSLWTQFRGGVGRGWREMVAYVRDTPLLHAGVVVLAVASFWIGWRAGAPLVDAGIETSIAARLEGHIAPAAALEFFGNNWLVAITTAFSGLALVIPAIVSLVFNGVYMGVIARTEAELMELVAFVVPHGIFEIPAIFIATAVGVTLGLTGWRAFRGRTTRVAFADELERAFWVLVGVGLLLLVAGIIEGFVSPYYYDLLL